MKEVQLPKQIGPKLDPLKKGALLEVLKLMLTQHNLSLSRKQRRVSSSSIPTIWLCKSGAEVTGPDGQIQMKIFPPFFALSRAVFLHNLLSGCEPFTNSAKWITVDARKTVEIPAVWNLSMLFFLLFCVLGDSSGPLS